MIPLSDHNPSRRFPFVTLLLIGACLWIYFVVQPVVPSSPAATRDDTVLDQLAFNVEYAAIPCEVVTQRPLTAQEVDRTFGAGDVNACQRDAEGPPAVPGKNIALSVLYSMFLHGSVLHIAGNVLFLWVFGNNVEDRMGHLRYLAFYLASGFVATAGHVIAQPDSTVPVVGASGAIAGIMGAYLVLHPNVPVLAFVGFLLLHVTAKWFLVLWFVGQFFVNPNAGVAWVAHVSGFLFGVAGGIWVRATRPEPDEPEAGLSRARYG